ncbi:hypothetical protein FB451DRAFT_1529600 [Mycena latifolia]|nr:hypothetical protein FB451DRAFT_1529600 [Mycena latifolia]
MHDRTYDLMVQITHFEKPPLAPAVSALARLRTSSQSRGNRAALCRARPPAEVDPDHAMVPYTEDFRYRTERMITAGQYGMNFVCLSGLPLRVWRRDEEGIDRPLDVPLPMRSRIWYHKVHAQQLAGVAAVENDSLKRSMRATGRDKTKDKTLNALKAKWKAKDEKKRRSSLPMEMSDSDSEDVQISKVDQEDERLFGKLKSAAEPALAKHSASPWFEKIVTGAWVRYLIGTNPDNAQVYRICQTVCAVCVALPSDPHRPRLRRKAVFELKHGNAEKLWEMDRTSTIAWTDGELNRLVGTYTNEKVPIPSRKDVDDRYAEMQELITKPITDVCPLAGMLARKRQLAGQGTAAPLGVAERSRLIAQRRHDYDAVGAIDAQLATLPEAAPAAEAPEDCLARVNERNCKANLEAVRRAEVLEAERKRRERKSRVDGAPAVVDPSARPGMLNPATLRRAATAEEGAVALSRENERKGVRSRDPYAETRVKSTITGA